jgi:membrane-associated phospholipid phosphatase
MEIITTNIFKWGQGLSYVYHWALIAEWLPYVLGVGAILWMVLYSVSYHDKTIPTIIRIATTPVFTTGITLIVVALLKSLIRIARPEYVMPLIEASGYGFPSGHAAFMGAWVGSFWGHMSTTVKVLAILASIFVIVGRVIGGVHTIVDVLFGFVIGLGIYFVIRFFSPSE